MSMGEMTLQVRLLRYTKRWHLNLKPIPRPQRAGERREEACCERIYGSPNVHCAIALPIVSDVLLQLRVVVDDALVRVTTIAHPIAQIAQRIQLAVDIYPLTVRLLDVRAGIFY